MRSSIYTTSNTLQPVDAALLAAQDTDVAITAYAGGGQTNATLLASGINSVDTVATAADSVKLPLAVAGLEVFVVNTTANSLQVFGSGTDTINAVATATGVAQAAGKSALYVCTTSAPAGKWFRILSA